MTITDQDRRRRRGHAHRRPPRLRSAGHAHAARQARRHDRRSSTSSRTTTSSNVQGAIPAPLNYAPPGYTPYPKSICTSINHQVCHGIPNDRPLKNGDIVNIDVTVIKDGWHGDTSRMFIVGEGSIAAKRLCADHLRGDVEGHRQGQAGRPPGRHRPRDPDASPRATASRWCASSAATASAAASTRSRRCCTTAGRARSRSSSPGMIFTIEPMINAGKREIRETRRRLDHRHQRPLAVGAVGAHRARHRDRLRGADAVGRQPAAAGVRRRADGADRRTAAGLTRGRLGAAATRRRLACDLRDALSRRARPALLDQLRRARAPTAQRRARAAARAGRRRRRDAARALGATPACRPAAGAGRRRRLRPRRAVPVLRRRRAGAAARAAHDGATSTPRRASRRFITACWDAGLEIGSQRAHRRRMRGRWRQRTSRCRPRCSNRAC